MKRAEVAEDRTFLDNIGFSRWWRVLLAPDVGYVYREHGQAYNRDARGLSRGEDDGF